MTQWLKKRPVVTSRVFDHLADVGHDEGLSSPGWCWSWRGSQLTWLMLAMTRVSSGRLNPPMLTWQRVRWIRPVGAMSANLTITEGYSSMDGRTGGRGSDFPRLRKANGQCYKYQAIITAITHTLTFNNPAFIQKITNYYFLYKGIFYSILHSKCV